MKKRFALAILALGGMAAAGSAMAQGATGSISRPGWSRGQAPSSDFNAQGTPLSRNEAVRQRAAAARGQAAPAQPRRRTRR
ncbi:hypothetical protein [Roseomonas indoligenes]|uniref:Uncharacterized protein n=1 Tax=Roseomonas indoligenes TaxID=2820811 RepID=A0A940S5L2_9PROT|nr:hypothetical protein [Pararoseomonas indoligenes]MBP0493075.1 hypothetical protein [Pararoseomonas indoligenes]